MAYLRRSVPLGRWRRCASPVGPGATVGSRPRCCQSSRVRTYRARASPSPRAPAAACYHGCERRPVLTLEVSARFRLEALAMNGFYREGEYWTLVFNGEVARLRASRGLLLLSRLLE